MTSLEIELVARAIHAADKTHSWEPWHSVREIYRAMAEAAVAQIEDIQKLRADERCDREAAA